MGCGGVGDGVLRADKVVILPLEATLHCEYYHGIPPASTSVDSCFIGYKQPEE